MTSCNRRSCMAAKRINADLTADKAQDRYDRTRSHKALIALGIARNEAVRLSGVRAGRRGK